MISSVVLKLSWLVRPKERQIVHSIAGVFTKSYSESSLCSNFLKVQWPIVLSSATVLQLGFTHVLRNGQNPARSRLAS